MNITNITNKICSNIEACIKKLYPDSTVSNIHQLPLNPNRPNATRYEAFCLDNGRGKHYFQLYLDENFVIIDVEILGNA